MNVPDFMSKSKQQKLSMITCYDAWSAKIIAQTPIDAVLIGDSSAMVMHGFESTIPCTVEMIAAHVSAVARVLKDKLIVADLPFLSYSKSREDTFAAVQTLMQAGAHAVKLEGCADDASMVKAIVQSGVPVMGHLGLTPQAVHQLGGYKVQGRQSEAAAQILKQAEMLEQAGCFSIVLECVPNQLAEEITKALSVPTIGIGAGPSTSGQVLVLQDMLGLQKEFQPKFVKQYMQGFELMQQALTQYHSEVVQEVFPCVDTHVYT